MCFNCIPSTNKIIFETLIHVHCMSLILDGCVYALKRSHNPVIGSADEWVVPNTKHKHTHTHTQFSYKLSCACFIYTVRHYTQALYCHNIMQQISKTCMCIHVPAHVCTQSTVFEHSSHSTMLTECLLVIKALWLLVN